MNEPRRPAVRKAVAVRYERGTDKAPRVVAKGDRLLADRIVEIARAHGIHVHEDPDLMAALATLDVDREIPESLYYAVAEVLAFVYHLDRKMGAPRGTP